jgi:sterol desaturase/sphingolipid hydroxylase (fatty acid hydroxylase superfamily)
VTVSARIAIEKFQVPAIERLPSLRGFAWMTEISRIVQWRVSWPIALVVSVVVLDFLLYWGHRLLHTAMLWHTHAAHHSVEHLYWFGGNRASPVHVASLAACGTLLALVWPVHGGHPGLVIELVIYACIQPFNHANLSWRLGFLGALFVTPRYHFVHHGAEARLNGSNFGFLLTIWDRMFGTYVSPARRSERLSARAELPGGRRSDVDRAAAGPTERGVSGARPVTPRRRGASGAGYGILHA